MRSGIRSSLLTAFLALGLSVSLMSGAPASAASTLETALATKINAARAAHGLRPLNVRVYLTDKAHAHSGVMARKNRLYHSDLTRICCWSRVGENVAYNSTVAGAHRALMRSPGHRANILNRSFRQVGVGIVKRDGRLWVTEIFRTPR